MIILTPVLLTRKIFLVTFFFNCLNFFLTSKYLQPSAISPNTVNQLGEKQDRLKWRKDFQQKPSYNVVIYHNFWLNFSSSDLVNWVTNISVRTRIVGTGTVWWYKGARDERNNNKFSQNLVNSTLEEPVALLTGLVYVPRVPGLR